MARNRWNFNLGRILVFYCSLPAAQLLVFLVKNNAMKARFLFISLSLIFSVFLFTGAVAQETTITKKEQKKLEKEQKKKEKDERAAADLELLKNMLQNRFFVFQASRLLAPSGQNWSVAPNINFLSIMDTAAVYQFGFEQLVGWNGAGGYTLEGFVVTYEFDDGGERKTMTVSATISPNIGQGRAAFILTVLDNGNADLDMTVSGGTLRMSGRVVSPAETGVFKGEYYR